MTCIDVKRNYRFQSAPTRRHVCHISIVSWLDHAPHQMTSAPQASRAETWLECVSVRMARLPTASMYILHGLCPTRSYWDVWPVFNSLSRVAARSIYSRSAHTQCVSGQGLERLINHPWPKSTGSQFLTQSLRICVDCLWKTSIVCNHLVFPNFYHSWFFIQFLSSTRSSFPDGADGSMYTSPARTRKSRTLLSPHQARIRKEWDF